MLFQNGIVHLRPPNAINTLTLHGRKAANRGGLNWSDKALRTPAFNALIDVMHEARLVRFGAGKAHLGVAFHAMRVFVEGLDLALWHCPPMIGCWHLATYGSTIGKLRQPTRIWPSHVEGVPHGAGINVIEPTPETGRRRLGIIPSVRKKRPQRGGS
jgi:hypothetical protein